MQKPQSVLIRVCVSLHSDLLWPLRHVSWNAYKGAQHDASAIELSAYDHLVDRAGLLANCARRGDTHGEHMSLFCAPRANSD